MEMSSRQVKTIKLMCLIPVISFIFASAVSAKSIDLVEQGKTDYIIVIEDNPMPQVTLAAEDLRQYIRKVTGADISIKKGNIKSEKAVYIGPNEALPKIADFDPAAYTEETFLIRFWNDSIAIMGAIENTDPFKDYGFGNFGILYGTYEFIERYLGVRWYTPGEFGECYEPKKDIIVSDLPLRQTAVSYSRTYWPRIFRLHSKKESMLWGRRLKYLGTKIICPNHSMQGFGHYYKDKNPEIFAVLPNGKRDFGKRDPNKKVGYGWLTYPQFCFSNPKTLELYLDAIDEFYKGTERGLEIWSNKYGGAQPTDDFIYVVPNDNFSGNMCHCPDCQKQLNHKRGYLGFGSDLVWGFVAKVAEEVKKKYPDKKVSGLAYNCYFMLPENVVLPDNVVVRICVKPWFVYLGAKTYREHVDKIVSDWKKRVTEISFWQYYMPYSDFPWQMPHRILQTYRKYKGLVKSTFVELTHTDQARRPMDFPVHGRNRRSAIDLPQVHLNLFLTMKAIWDPETVDVDRELDLYYKLFYGPAEEPMRKFFELIAQRWENADDVEMNPTFRFTGGDVFEKIYPSEIVKKLDAYLKEASGLAKENSIYAKRIAWHREEYFDEFLKLAQSCYRQTKENWALMFPASAAPVIDGSLDDAVWKNTSLYKFVDTAGGLIPRFPSTFRMAYDQKNLYFAVEASDPHLKSATLSCKERDTMVYTDDSVEIFLGTDINRPDAYYQVIISLSGVIFDRRVDGPKKRDVTWNGDILSKTVMKKDRWIMEAAVSLQSLGIKAVREGETWRFNICRNKKSGVQEVRESTQWVPTFIDFNRPRDFGKMLFCEKAVFVEDFASAEDTASRFFVGFNRKLKDGKRKIENERSEFAVEDGALKWSVRFPENPDRVQGSYASLHFKKPLKKNIAGTPYCEIRFLNPHKDVTLAVVYTYEDASGKTCSDFYRICMNDPSEKWRIRGLHFAKDGVHAKKKRGMAGPVILKYLAVYASVDPQSEEVVRTIEIDYIRITSTPIKDAMGQR